MPGTKRVMFFANGNTAVLDEGGQIPELQESWLLVFVEWLKSRGIDPDQCDIVMPNGDRAILFKTGEGSLSWRLTP